MTVDRIAATLLFVGAVAAALAVSTARANDSAGSSAAQRGEQIYTRCLACHALAYDRVGPRHCGLIGRKAGSVAGFEYSAAMKKSGLVWNEATLSRFIAKPLKVVPGSTMTYDGVVDAKERADLIAYLKAAGEGAECHK
jgi:cytochrome c